MAQYFQVHRQNPQLRLIRRAVEILQGGGVLVYPTDSSYALGCRIDEKQGLERIRRIRMLEEEHHFTLICKDLSQISAFAKFGNDAHRLIRQLTPGPFTFILRATREVPRRLQHPKGRTIGIRLPDNPVTQLLLAELGEPLFNSTLIPPDQDEALSDPLEIRDALEKTVDLILDSGIVNYAPTTVLDLSGDEPVVVRQGRGIVDFLA
jgi:tRNA threonylcarbamoyl adenosine modification protein (Sua5/YciO/YrdC/YwlC family)